MTNEQAFTCFEQLAGGANRMITMIGAYNFLRDEEKRWVSFKFRGSQKMNYCKITLRGDLYEVEFGKVGKFTYAVKKSLELVFATQLRRIFETTTGLCLSVH